MGKKGTAKIENNVLFTFSFGKEVIKNKHISISVFFKSVYIKIKIQIFSKL